MFEQIYQCSKYGLHKIILNLVEYCIKEKCSEESSKTLMNEFGGNNNVERLAMAIIESAAISEGLKPKVIRAGNDNLFRSEVFSKTVAMFPH